MKKLIPLLKIVFLIAGCSADELCVLSGDYVYYREGTNAKSIMSRQAGKGEIYGTVIDYSYNWSFITAKQVPNYDCYQGEIQGDIRTDKMRNDPSYINNVEGIHIALDMADSILKTDPYYLNIFANDTNYWIISHKDDSLYGPYTKAEFNEICIKLKVPKRLRLD